MNIRPAIRNAAIALAALFLAAPAGAATIEDVIRMADTSRGGNLPGVSWTVNSEARTASGVDTNSLDVVSVDTDWAAEFTTPASSRGDRLVKRGTNMWFSKPSLRKPVPISLRQRLTGAASNGDLASTNYLRDYSVKRLPDETISGVDTYVVELTAKSGNVAYDRIKYWIAKSNNLGVAANFYTSAGRLLKSATFRYDNRISHNGRQVPFISRMTINDKINEGEVTTLTYVNPTVRSIPSTQLQP